LPQIERDPLITYYAINKRGDLRTNTHSEGPNAVTWGIFPGKEIVQPTIVEALSFMAWKVNIYSNVISKHLIQAFPSQDEAFELGVQWSQLYDQESPTQKLISDMMETYSLVNVVHNDFRDPEAIFSPFYRAAQTKPPNGIPNGSAATNGLVNGHA
jgi:methylenetetrahydrofolate reductase (NADPH)